MEDLLLLGGTVVDGTGGEPVTADVAVSNGVIQAIGDLAPSTARRVVDVTGAVVCPGFIDLHSHADYSIFADPEAVTQLHQGVTTLVTGNCGFSPFPVTDEHADDVRRHRALGSEPLPWEWHTTAEFLAAVERLPLGVNLACLVGHGTLRIATMGTERATATESQATRMRELLREAVGAGAVGLSSGLIYAPGSFATQAELVGLCREIAAAGLIYTSHIRDEGNRHAEAIEEILAVAHATGARVQVSHLKAIGPKNWGKVQPALRSIEAANRAGADVGTDVYPYTATNTTLTSRLPAWALDGGIPSLLERLADETVSAHIAQDMADNVGATFLPDRTIVSELGPGAYADVVGRSIGEIADILGVDAPSAVLELLRAHHEKVRIVIHALSEDDVQTVLSHPLAAVVSDGYVLTDEGEGMPHPRSFGTFTRVLGRYVRDLGVLSLSDAVRKMTGLPASRLGWTDRGTLRPGTIADICVFDPQAVADRSTFEAPWQLSTGVVHTLIGGRFALEDAAVADDHCGRLIRGRVAAA